MNIQNITITILAISIIITNISIFNVYKKIKLLENNIKEINTTIEDINNTIEDINSIVTNHKHCKICGEGFYDIDYITFPLTRTHKIFPKHNICDNCENIKKNYERIYKNKKEK